MRPCSRLVFPSCAGLCAAKQTDTRPPPGVHSTQPSVAWMSPERDDQRQVTPSSSPRFRSWRSTAATTSGSRFGPASSPARVPGGPAPAGSVGLYVVSRTTSAREPNVLLTGARTRVEHPRRSARGKGYRERRGAGLALLCGRWAHHCRTPGAHEHSPFARSMTASVRRRGRFFGGSLTLVGRVTARCTGPSRIFSANCTA